MGNGGKKRFRIVAAVAATSMATVALTVAGLALVPHDRSASQRGAVVSAQVVVGGGLAVYDCPEGTMFTRLPPGVIVHWLGNQSGANTVPTGWALIDYNAAGTALLGAPPTIMPFDAFHAHVTGWVKAAGLRLSASAGHTIDGTWPAKALQRCNNGTGKAVAVSSPITTMAPAVLSNFLTRTTTTTTTSVAPPAPGGTSSPVATTRPNVAARRARPHPVTPPPETEGPLTTSAPPATASPAPLTVPTTLVAAPSSTLAPTTSIITTAPTTTVPATTTTTSPFLVDNLDANPGVITSQRACDGLESVSQVTVEISGGAAPYTVLLTYSVGDLTASTQMVNPASPGQAGTWYADVPNSPISRSAIGSDRRVPIVVQVKAIDNANTTGGLVDAGLLRLRTC